MSERDEESGADAATEEECLVPADPSHNAEEDFSPFEEVNDSFLNEPLKKVMGPDGLPMPVDPGQRSDIPPLSLKTLVCMGDFSKFVIRNVFGDVMAEFLPNEVARSPAGAWRVRKDLMLDRMQLELKRMRENLKERASVDPAAAQMQAMPDDTMLFHVIHEIGHAAGRCFRANREWFEVEPIRPPCRHYVRQMTQFEYNPENDAILRLCSARRTTEGTFMSVRDRKMSACDMRDPPDLESESQIDEFDKKKIEQGATREYFSIFEGYGPAGRPANTNPMTYER